MNNKKIIIPCLILVVCILLTLPVTAVSDDDMGNHTLASNDVEDQISVSHDNSEIIQQTNDEEKLEATIYAGGGTFADLQNVINSAGADDTIVLTGDYYCADNAGGIKINNKGYFTIDGNGHTIDALSKGSIFITDSTSKVTYLTLKNIVFRNAYSTDNGDSTTGGAVRLVGNGSVLNCTFINNIAPRAGAIYWGYAHDVTIDNCKFYSNKATGAGGGAIRIRNDMVDVVVSNCLFVDNVAETYAGAVHYSSTQGSKSNSIINCTFINNTAKQGGGAAQIQAPTCIVKDSRFINNTAGANDGGAIYWDGKVGEVINSNFTNNKAEGSGGAIYCSGETSTIIGSLFVNNNATHGGAIRWANKTNDGKIMYSQFINNYAIENAGAISWLNSTNGQILHSNFINNRAGNRGGAVRWSGTTGLIQNVTFSKNTAGNYGGAVMGRYC